MNMTDKLVRMANQIAANLEIHGHDKAVAEAADHIMKFWDPRMKALAATHLAAGGEGLGPIALAALKQVKVPNDTGAKERNAS